jgi:hypothetical protein
MVPVKCNLTTSVSLKFALTSMVPVKYDLTMWMIIVPQVDLDHSMVPVKCDLTV